MLQRHHMLWVAALWPGATPLIHEPAGVRGPPLTVVLAGMTLGLGSVTGGRVAGRSNTPVLSYLKTGLCTCPSSTGISPYDAVSGIMGGPDNTSHLIARPISHVWSAA